MLAATSLAACGGDEPGTTAPVTLKVWIMGDDGSKFEELVEGFTGSNITVDVDAIPWDSVNEKLTTAVASGNGPDVMQIGLSLLPTFVNSGALADISSVGRLVPEPGQRQLPRRGRHRQAQPRRQGALGAVDQ